MLCGKSWRTGDKVEFGRCLLGIILTALQCPLQVSKSVPTPPCAQGAVFQLGLRRSAKEHQRRSRRSARSVVFGIFEAIESAEFHARLRRRLHRREWSSAASVWKLHLRRPEILLLTASRFVTRGEACRRCRRP